MGAGYASTQIPPEIIKNLWRSVDIGGPDDCWPWKLHHSDTGYGVIGFTRKGLNQSFSAHRVAWFATYGEIPEGGQITHTCERRDCCNPRHLKAFGSGFGICQNGHSYNAKGRCPTCQRKVAPGKRARRIQDLKDRENHEPLKSLMENWDQSHPDCPKSQRTNRMGVYATVIGQLAEAGFEATRIDGKGNGGTATQ